MPAFLIVDQDPRFAAGLRSVLEAEGWPGKTTTDAREAAKMALEEPPELLLASVEVDGATVLLDRFSMRSDTGCSSIAFVPAARASEVKAEQLGADGLLPRPCTRDQFWSTVRRVLSEAQKRAAPPPSNDSTKLTSAELFGDLLEEVDGPAASAASSPTSSPTELPGQPLPRSGPVKVQLGQSPSAPKPLTQETAPERPVAQRPARGALGSELEKKLEQTLSGVLDLGAQKPKAPRAPAPAPPATSAPVAADAPATDSPAASPLATSAPAAASSPAAPPAADPPATSPPAAAPPAPASATPPPTATSETPAASTGTPAGPTPVTKARRRGTNVDDLLNQTLSGLVDLEALGKRKAAPRAPSPSAPSPSAPAPPAPPVQAPPAQAPPAQVPPSAPPRAESPQAVSPPAQAAGLPAQETSVGPAAGGDGAFTTMKLPTGAAALAAAMAAEAEQASSSETPAAAAEAATATSPQNQSEPAQPTDGNKASSSASTYSSASTDSSASTGSSASPDSSASSGVEAQAERVETEETESSEESGEAAAHPMALEPPGLGALRQQSRSIDEDAFQAALAQQAASSTREGSSVQDTGWFDELVGDEHERTPVRISGSDSPLAAAGRRFGSYTLVERIAIGGMAEVWKARMSGAAGFQKIVAIKKILSHLTANIEFEKMFVDEAKLAAQLNHPNITQIYDLGQVRGEYYIAMEYVDGKDLRTILDLAQRYEYPLSEGLTLLIASRLASGLDHAHRRRDENHQELGLVHRDVSPQNVLIGYEGDVKLCDFGIVKAVSKASQTQMGALKGKLQYMSPEQAWGKAVDARTDLFSVGALMFEMLTGRRLFVGDSELSVLEAVRECRVESPRNLNPNISIEVDEVVMQALAKDPDDRFQTAATLRDRLEDLLLQLPKRPGPHELSYYLKHLTAVAEGRQPPTPLSEDSAPFDQQDEPDDSSFGFGGALDPDLLAEPVDEPAAAAWTIEPETDDSAEVGDSAEVEVVADELAPAELVTEGRLEEEPSLTMDASPAARIELESAVRERAPETLEDAPSTYELPSWDVQTDEAQELPEFELTVDEEAPLGADAVVAALAGTDAAEASRVDAPPTLDADEDDLPQFELAPERDVPDLDSTSFDNHPMATGTFDIGDLHGDHHLHDDSHLPDVMDLNTGRDDFPEDLAFDATAQEDYAEGDLDQDVPPLASTEQDEPFGDSSIGFTSAAASVVPNPLDFDGPLSSQAPPSQEPAGPGTPTSSSASGPVMTVAAAAEDDSPLRPVSQMSGHHARESSRKRWIGLVLLLLLLGAATIIYLFVEGILTLPGEAPDAQAPQEIGQAEDETVTGLRATVLAGLQEIEGEPGPPVSAAEVQPPKLVNIGKAQYPRAGRQHDLDGHVVLALLVDPEGKVEQVRVLEEQEASPSLVQLALDLAAKADFLPARRATDGDRIRMWTQLRIAFES